METYRHVSNYVFKNCVKDNRGLPLFTYDVVLVSSDISKRLHKMGLMSIGFDGKLQIHHYNAQVLTALKNMKVEEE